MLNTHSALLLNFVNLLSVWPHFYIKIVSLNEQTWMVPPTLTMKADRWMCLSFYQESHLPWKSHAKVLEKRVRPIVKPIQKDNMVFFLVVEWSAFFLSSQRTEASQESAYPVYMCFVNLEKAYNRVPQSILCEVQEYGLFDSYTFRLRAVAGSLSFFTSSFGMSIKNSEGWAVSTPLDVIYSWLRCQH